MSEKNITSSILKFLNSLPKTRAIKVHGGYYSSNGEPDIDCVIDGQSVKIEVKRHGQKPTPLQLAIIEKWKDAGSRAFIATSIDDVKRNLNML